MMEFPFMPHEPLILANASRYFRALRCIRIAAARMPRAGLIEFH